MASNKIGVVVLSGTREHLQMAGEAVSAGAVSGNEVRVFLAMNAMQYFVKGVEAQAPCEGPVGKLMEQKNSLPFKVLFEIAVTLGDAKIFPCAMTMDVLGIERDALEDYIGEPMGLTLFLEECKGGQVWSF